MPPMGNAHDIELMQHADGELPKRSSSELEAQLDRDPDARLKVEALAEIGELVRGHLELAADAVPNARFEALWREVDKVVQNSAPAAAVVAATAAPRAGAWRRISRWFEVHRSHIIVGAVSAGAVAALAIVMGPGSSVDGGYSTTNGPIEVRPAALRSPPAIESLETPGGTGNVLEIDDEDGHTAVIWVTPQDTVEGI